MTQQQKNKSIDIGRIIGNVLIATSLLSLAFLFYPAIQMYIFPPEIQQVPVQKGIFITIPKIHAQAPIVENVDPWNEAEYQQALMRGVAHAKTTSRPGESGTVFLFAHSSGPLWAVNRYNTIFYRLGELQYGDDITLTIDGKNVKYVVTNKIEVWPSEIKYLEKNDKDQLILQTCTPVGTSLKRLLVFAEPTKNLD